MAASQRITHVLIPLALLILCVLMVLFPVETWHAGVRGLSIWWDVLFPSLFPFLVLSELLLGFGIVHFFGYSLKSIDASAISRSRKRRICVCCQLCFWLSHWSQIDRTVVGAKIGYSGRR